jgi:hypothetical protein
LCGCLFLPESNKAMLTEPCWEKQLGDCPLEAEGRWDAVLLVA